MHPATERPSPTSSRLPAIALLLAACGLAPAASAQWTVVNLHPAGAPSSEACGVQGGQQVGQTGTHGAVLWTGTAASAVTLNPSAQDAAANCVENGLQAGYAIFIDSGNSRDHAALWSGTAGSFVDLQPAGAIASAIYTMHGGVQGGVWFPPGGGMFTPGCPGIWQGTPESFVDLTPAGYTTGEVHGVNGGQQVGGTFDTGLAQACMWYGTPGSFVNLQPESSLFSIALCTNGVNQFGVILDWDGVDYSTLNAQVGHWSGSAASWVNMTPAGYFAGGLTAVDGNQQVGSTAADAMGNPPFRAAYWTGTAESFVDLHAFLPPEFTESSANGIWYDHAGTTYVVGYGFNSTTNRNEAIMWARTGCPADYNHDGFVDGIDYDLFNNDFENFDPAQQMFADYNGDGFVDGIDYDLFNNDFASLCP